MTSSNGLNDPTVARRVLIVDELDSIPIDTWNVVEEAEGGDYDAMASLRDWYKEGKNGLHKNVADKWYGRMLKKRAGDGDVPSMLELAYAYYHGRNSLEASSEEAYKWFKKAADLMDVTGMAEAGDSLARGDGVKANRAYGMALLAAAAGLGSAIACTYLASMYCDGEVGLPKDLQHAKFWYKKAIDGSCHTNDMNKSDIENVEKKIKEIEDAE